MMPPAIISREPIPMHEVSANQAPATRKEHGALFKAGMVRALQREVDPKWQTRRLFTRHNSLVDGRRATSTLWADLDFDAAWVDAGPSPAGNDGPYLKVPRRSDGSVHRVYATIAVGDWLWVRESGWQRPSHRTARQLREGADTWPSYLYDADGHIDADELRRWGWKRRTGIHMPRAACRLVLDVTAIRIQHLQEIDTADAIAEGTPGGHGAIDGYSYNATPLEHYRWLWGQINGARSWAANPWVRVFEFRRVTP
ncbi:hypothetical protein [Variovorax sp. UC122_21]|uniref:hypothetical protein n=1 Tax=Variovorax sp. UC122_21 TaxID=3374554 RepID=UPI003756DA01